MKSTITAALAAAALSGCVAVPAYDDPYYAAPAYYPAPAARVYVAPPTVYFGGSYSSGGRHHHHRGHRGRHRH